MMRGLAGNVDRAVTISQADVERAVSTTHHTVETDAPLCEGAAWSDAIGSIEAARRFRPAYSGEAIRVCQFTPGAQR